MPGLSDPTVAPYDASSIRVLSDVEAIRRTPSVYIGTTGQDGLHHLVFELIDNALDEARVGAARSIHLTLRHDGSCSVDDDGRGIPVELIGDTGQSALEVVLSTLSAGAKFGGETYGSTAGILGAGLACVNALSARLSVDVRRDGYHHSQEYERGRPTTQVMRRGETPGHGTTVTFQPDPQVFGDSRIDPAVVAGRLEELAFLFPTVRFTLVDGRTAVRRGFSGDGGIAQLLAARIGDSSLVHPHPIVLTVEDGSVSIAVVLQWTEAYGQRIWSFVNSVRVKSGSHVDGLRDALVESIRELILNSTKGAISTSDDVTLDVLDGLAAVLSVDMDAPNYDSQAKERLQDQQIGRLVFAHVEPLFSAALNADPDLATGIVNRASISTRARLAAPTQRRGGDVQIDYTVYQDQFGVRSKNWHESCAWLTDEGLLRTHSDMCDVEPDARLLDVCCGSGVVGQAFDGRVAEKVGLDITPQMVQLASIRLDVVHQGTVYDLSYPDENFDLVVNREVLHLLPMPERPLSQIYRVLRPGGQFIVGQIMPYGPEDAYWMFRIFKKKQPLLMNMFLEPAFRELLHAAGFVDLKMREYYLWESINRWIDTYETPPSRRTEILNLYKTAPRSVRSVHPFRIDADGEVHDQWRWCVYSVRKPQS